MKNIKYWSFAVASIWIASSVAIIFALYWTKNAEVLWAYLIVALATPGYDKKEETSSYNPSGFQEVKHVYDITEEDKESH